MASSVGVTFKVATHPATPVSPRVQRDGHLGIVSHLRESPDCERLIQASPLSPLSFQPSDSGFVRGVVQAYCRHHNLVIRPDDVWLAILIQFGFYVNANAEAFRSLFVSHKGKKELVVHQNALGLDTANYELFASLMASKLRENVKDPSFCDWVFPSFSTTTHNDTAVASVVLMATLKQYFDYKCCLACGIPQITLAGTVQDWEDIHARIDRLENGGYGKVCSAWASMLKKITRQFIQTSRNLIDVDFWSQICHYTSGGSGPRYLSGWITAFCVFDGKGNWQATNYSIPGNWGIRRRSSLSLTHLTYLPAILQWMSWGSRQSEPKTLEFPVIDTSDIPPGYITVDVTVDDNGKEYKTLMFAGHLGYDIVEEGKGIAPKLAWAIALKSLK